MRISYLLLLFGMVLLAAACTYQPSGNSGTGTLVQVSSNTQYGSILVDKNGNTVYTFAADSLNNSVCTGACAQAWPPLAVPSGTSPQAGQSVTGKLGSITRSDGLTQVTYNGQPLYLYSGDTVAGQANGQGLNSFGGLWYVVSP